MIRGLGRLSCPCETYPAREGVAPGQCGPSQSLAIEFLC